MDAEGSDLTAQVRAFKSVIWLAKNSKSGFLAIVFLVSVVTEIINASVC